MFWEGKNNMEPNKIKYEGFENVFLAREHPENNKDDKKQKTLCHNSFSK